MPPFADNGPVLDRVPDARASALPQLPAVAYVYLSLLIGIVPTCVVLGVMGAALGRSRLIVGTLLLGLGGFLAPVVPLLGFQAAGAEPHVPLIIFLVRLLGVLLGWLAFKLAHPYVRGHAQLGGRLVPLMWTILPAFGLLFFMPGRIVWGLIAPILVLGGGG